MSKADLAISYVLAQEGGLVDNPNDAGKLTNMGISLRFLKSISGTYCEPGEEENFIRNLTQAEAAKIYKDEFWIPAYDRISTENVSTYVFDMAVNMGPANAHKVTQRAVWAMSKNRELLLDDGVMGEKTIIFLNSYGVNMMPPLRAERAGWYRRDVVERSQLAEDLNGFLNRCYAL